MDIGMIGPIVGAATNILGALGGGGGAEEAAAGGPSEGDVEMMKALLASDMPGQTKAALVAEYLDQLGGATAKGEGEGGGNGLMDMIGGIVEGIGGIDFGGLAEGLGGLLGGLGGGGEGGGGGGGKGGK